MSIKVMSQVWEAEGLSPTHRLILLSLADHAGDDGICYPSIERLCKRTGLSERAIQGAVKALRDAGWLEIQVGGGRNRCNLYCVKTPQQMHPAADAPPSETPQMSAETPQMSAKNPAADAPEPLRTVKEPSKSNAREAREVFEALCEVVSEETAQAFIDHRKAKRAKLTANAARLIAKKLSGHPQADAVVEDSIANGWTGVFPDKHRAATVTQFPRIRAKF